MILAQIIYLPKTDKVPSWHNPKRNPDDFILHDGVNIHTGSDHRLR